MTHLTAGLIKGGVQMLKNINEIQRPQKIVPLIAKKLIEIIEKENIPVGGKLPSEKELSEAFGVGRSSIREALQVLETHEIIETRKGVGRFLINDIDSINAGNLSEWIEHRVENTPLKKLLEARCILESAIIELSVKRATKKNVDEMITKLNCFSKITNDPSEFFEKEMEFHQYVISLCDNSILTELMNTLIEKLYENEKYFKRAAEKNVIEAIDSAKKLIKAFQCKDAHLAKNIVKQHIAAIDGLL